MKESIMSMFEIKKLFISNLVNQNVIGIYAHSTQKPLYVAIIHQTPFVELAPSEYKKSSSLKLISI